MTSLAQVSRLWARVVELEAQCRKAAAAGRWSRVHTLLDDREKAWRHVMKAARSFTMERDRGFVEPQPPAWLKRLKARAAKSKR